MNEARAIKAIEAVIEEAEKTMYKGREVKTTQKAIRQIEELGLTAAVEKAVPGITNPGGAAYHRLNAVIDAANEKPGVEGDYGQTAEGDYDGAMVKTKGSELWQAMTEEEQKICEECGGTIEDARRRKLLRRQPPALSERLPPGALRQRAGISTSAAGGKAQNTTAK